MRVQRLAGGAAVLVAAGFAACSSLHFTETSQQLVTITPVNMGHFGDVAIGGMASTDVTIAPSGSTTETDLIGAFDASGCSSEWTLSFPQGPPPTQVDQSCGSGYGGSGYGGTTGCTSTTWTFTVTFAPTGAAGMRSCTLAIPINSSPVALTFDGNAVQSNFLIAVTPQPSLDMGYVQQGIPSGPFSITVKNAGAMPLMINSVTLTNHSAIQFQSGNTAPHSLAVGDTNDYELVCTPPGLQTYQDTFTVSSNATNMPSATVMVTCTGTDAMLSTSPQAKFAAMRIGDAARSLPITVSDGNGSGSDTIDDYQMVAGSNPDVTITAKNVGPISSGSPRSVTLSYAPTAAANGSLGTLRILYNGSKQFDVPVSGEADPTAFAITESSIDFGPLCVGETSPVHHVSIYATQAGSFKVPANGFTVPSAPFSVSGVPLPFTVQGNHGNEFGFDVSVTPAQAMTYAGQVTVATDIPMIAGNQTSATVGLAVQGLADGVSATPLKLEFPTTHVNALSPGKTVTLTNCGTGPIDVLSAQIQGLDAADFDIVLPTDPAMTLQKHDAEAFTLVLKPLTKGSKSASLVIAYMDPAGMQTQVIDLEGAADVAAAGGKDRETYYACGVGRPIGIWPIALALVLLGRRRRARSGRIR